VATAWYQRERPAGQVQPVIFSFSDDKHAPGLYTPESSLTACSTQWSRNEITFQKSLTIEKCRDELSLTK